ncbi:hypothetical protein [Candidatus Contendibacter odensensis]|uniref:Uncharacterized protein n=1 Tax=Candidatus Contendobacter odensis Run_B_J11 TaxID=1400861 RepID=A0A7U7J4N3_9GAMM|nr:hypothetical protein [Candidatus Contendobacter odensis]CDH45510.1 exported hypothetical protein [Candidatus Contendobacter odensis Run_B_J11]
MQRKHVQNLIGVFTMLLLAWLLALGGHPCPMPTPANSALPSSAHGCCPDQVITPDLPADTDFFQQPCDVTPCLHSVTHHGVTDRHGLLTGTPDGPSQSIVVAWQLPSVWENSGQNPPPSLAAEIIGPRPPQRSRILRL